jgi:hypothetical protein
VASPHPAAHFIRVDPPEEGGEQLPVVTVTTAGSGMGIGYCRQESGKLRGIDVETINSRTLEKQARHCKAMPGDFHDRSN